MNFVDINYEEDRCLLKNKKSLSKTKKNPKQKNPLRNNGFFYSGVKIPRESTQKNYSFFNNSYKNHKIYQVTQ